MSEMNDDVETEQFLPEEQPLPPEQLAQAQQLSAREQTINVAQINREFRALAALNGWQAYHTPKNLAAAVAVEASELLAEFQWLTAEESKALDSRQKAQVADEVADVIMYLTELCMQLDINMGEAVQTKINKNTQRFKNL